MRRILFLIAACIFHVLTVAAQDDSIQARIVIIGDAGSLKKDAQGNQRHYVVSAVKKTIPLNEKTTVIYVGDNLYYTGLPNEQLPNYDIRRAVLDSQALIAKDTKAKVYFMPGNHDWNRMGPGGWAAIKREQRYIDGEAPNVEFYPKDGCPGPVEVSINNDITLIIIDSQWWLQAYEKPGIESDCGAKTKEEVLSQIDDILARNTKKLVIFACHHPFASYGIHGGYFTLKQHIFPFTEMKKNMYIPLPVIGSIYPITRSVFGTSQDLHSPQYENMWRDLQGVLKKYPNVIYIAGHEHNLQLIKDSSSYYLISGAGTNRTRVSKNKQHLLYGAQEYGFAELQISKNKNVNYSFYTVNEDSVKRTYDSTLVNFAHLPKEAADTKVATVLQPVKDSIAVEIYPAYDSVSSTHRYFLGNNYRKEWATPVKLKVLNVKKQLGDFSIESFGGGKETQTLRLIDAAKKNWELRTVNKDPQKSIPEDLRGSITKDIVQDLISSLHPYAALTIPPMANAVNVPVAKPHYYYTPDDNGFGIYREKFANKVVLLEEHDASIDDKDTKSTAKIIDKMIDDNDDRIDEQEVLRARLLDMLTGDWDRHFDQFRWGTSDTGKGKLYYTIPRDRDEAYFYNNGLLMHVVSSQILPYLKNFTTNIKRLKWLNWKARDFDRFFLTQLNENDWKLALDSFKIKETDSVLNTALKRMPPEIYKIDSATLLNKLKSRRDALPVKGLRYFHYLSKYVNVVGSNDREYFKVFQQNDSLAVHVYKIEKKSGDTSSLMYSRVFDSHHTKEIRLYGLNGNDRFYVSPNVSSKIKLRMIGGVGNDSFDINGKVKNYVYDVSSENNFIGNKNRTKDFISRDVNANYYSPTAFNYTVNRYPQITVGYNSDDKWLIGFGALRRTYGFRKAPFASEQRLNVLYALNNPAFQIKYQGEFNDVLHKKDILVHAEIVDPVLNNFFGFGNETVYDKNKGIDFYHVRYRYITSDILVRKKLGTIIQLMAGPVFYHYWNNYNDNNNRILGKPDLIGLDSSSIYNQKSYAGGKFDLLINNLDNVLLPTRGINWLTEFTSLGGLNNNSQPYTSLVSNMTVHAAVTDPAKVVAVLKLGGGRIYSKHYEYFQTLNLGADNFLRGFRKERFSGTSMAYASIEMRFKLFTSSSYIVPGDVGVIAFNDVGRVWLRGQTSHMWHDAYGGGIYYAAYNYALISASIAYSKEEHVFNFSLGTKFNITF
ncbi:MAG: metallophosphoesterase [Parafilimonas sp.]